MEILQRKRQVNTANYVFFLLSNKYRFFQLKEQNNTNQLTIQCSLGGHGDDSMKLFSYHKCCYNSQ